jgi:hypothetical protein
VSLNPRDKIELTVATGILTVFVLVEVTQLAPLEYEYLLHLLVVTALLAIFGDNVAKARELLAE